MCTDDYNSDNKKNKSSLILGEINSTCCIKSLTQLLEILEKEFKIIMIINDTWTKSKGVRFQGGRQG